MTVQGEQRDRKIVFVLRTIFFFKYWDRTGRKDLHIHKTETEEKRGEKPVILTLHEPKISVCLRLASG